jgi:hypothetical protein
VPRPDYELNNILFYFYFDKLGSTYVKSRYLVIYFFVFLRRKKEREKGKDVVLRFYGFVVLRFAFRLWNGNITGG